MDRLHIATFNILNLADRWPERQGLIYADMAALQPDILGLQEVVYVMHQDRLMGRRGEGTYRAHRAWAGRPEYGNSLLVREPWSVTEWERLTLSHGRSAGRGSSPSRRRARPRRVTHFHHAVDAEADHDAQATSLLDWLAAGPASDAVVAVGDFNAEPVEAAAPRIRGAGFRSAYAEANGADPDVTWPSGLQAPAMDTDGEPGCLDYIWIRGAVRVVSAPARAMGSSRTPRIRRSSRAITWASARTSRSDDGRRCVWPIAATGATRRRTRSTRSRRPWPSLPATAWSSMSRCLPTGRRW